MSAGAGKHAVPIIISYLVGTGKRPEGVSKLRHPFSPTRAGGEVSVTGPF